MSTPSAFDGNPHVGDIGTIFKATVYDNQNGLLVLVDLTPYTTLQMDFENESGQIPGSPFSATLSGPAGNGQLQYINGSPSILTVPGTWRYRPIIITGSGNRYTGSWIIMQVDP